MPRRYASTTTVPIAKTRGEIDALLRQWGCGAIQWTDDFDLGTVTLRFRWTYEDQQYMARFSIALREIDEQDILNLKTGRISEAKKAKAEEAQGKVEHRLLLLWLKAALNAVDAGIIDVTTIFLPFLEDQKGRTFHEIIQPRLTGLDLPALLANVD